MSVEGDKTASLNLAGYKVMTTEIDIKVRSSLLSKVHHKDSNSFDSTSGSCVLVIYRCYYSTIHYLPAGRH